jgi:hypothetical protein
MVKWVMVKRATNIIAFIFENLFEPDFMQKYGTGACTLRA